MIAKEYYSEKSLGMDIIEFFECPWLLNINFLSPVQKVILKSIMGMPLDDKTPIALDHEYQLSRGPYARQEPFENEIDMYKWFTGKKDYEIGYYADVDLCVGRRSGKSTAVGAGLALYFATQFDYEPFLRTSPHATIPIISPTKDQAGEVYSSIKQMILRSPYLFETFMDGQIDSFQEEYSEEDIKGDGKLTGGMIKLNNKVHIKVMAADMSKMRGMAVPFAILDEVCFFGVDGNDAKNTDKSIYEALSPALSQFQTVAGMALILKISSPNGQAGLMYDAFTNKDDVDVLHFQIPSWYANPTIPIRYLEKQQKKGAAFFDREYGAQYTASETSYLDPDLVDETVLKGVDAFEPQDGYRYVAAMDYATKGDYWTLAIGHKEYVMSELEGEKRKKERIVIDYLTHWRGQSGNELNPAEIIPQIAAILKKYRVHFLITDQYAYAPLRTLFQRHGTLLKEFTVTNASKLKYMYSLQIAINSGTLNMVNNPLAVKHLKDLREKRSTQSNKIRIEHAQNCHDDYADVIALVAYQFDKSSPLFVGTHVEEDEGIKSTKDARGMHVAYPTAEEMAQKAGIGNSFNDNRKEVEERLKKEAGEDTGEPEDDTNDFWFIF